MSEFTPGQIQEILDIFFDNFAHRQYIGARYVPVFGRKDEESIDWDNSEPYEPLTIVLHEGNSYTSRQFVPAGVDIANGEYWAETGNYNAQIEQYRQDVGNLSELVGDISNIIPASSFSAENTVKDYIDNSFSNTSKNLVKGAYLGRICFYDSTENTTGACTLIDDDTLVFTGTNSVDSNQCIVYLVDLSTKTVINTYTRNLNHCNGMCYNKAANKIYVSPNWDYSTDSRMQSIFECSATTFLVENEYTFDFEPHAVAYDAVTEKMYIIGTPEISIYEFDTNTHQATLVKTVTISSLLNKTETLESSFFGWQDSAAYDGNIYCLRSGAGGNCVVRISLDSDDYRFYYLDRKVGYFTDPEPEGIEIDSMGNAIICGRSVSAGGSWQMFGTIYKIPITTPVNTTDLTFSEHGRIGDCVVDGTIAINNTICPDGSSEKPFPTFLEAVMAMPLFVHRNITVAGDTVLKNLGNKKVYDNLNISVGAGKVLEFPNAVYFKDCRFTGASTHGIFKRPANVSTQVFHMFGMCGIRQMDFDFDDAATAVSFAQTRQGVIIIMDSTELNNEQNAPIARGEKGSMLLAGQNVTGTFTNYTGTIYPAQ